MGNKERKLTLKQRKWLEVYLETGNATEAARQAYNCKSDGAAGVIGYENLRKLKISISEMMDRMGLSDARLMKILEDGLTACKVELAKFEGNITDEKSFPDFPTRGAYLEKALKLKGHLLGLGDQDGEVQVAKVILVPVKQVEKELQPE